MPKSLIPALLRVGTGKKPNNKYIYEKQLQNLPIWKPMMCTNLSSFVKISLLSCFIVIVLQKVNLKKLILKI